MLKREKAMGVARCLMQDLTPCPGHAMQVCRISLMLFDQLCEVLHLPPSRRDLLELAALLHDIGQSVDFPLHHKHARDIILKTDLPGLSDMEHAMVACTARYHRKAHPDKRHKIYRDLKSKDQDIVRSLAALLRVADGLDRSQRAYTEWVQATLSDDRLVIYVTQKHANDEDLFGATRKKALLEEVLGLPVDIRRMEK